MLISETRLQFFHRQPPEMFYKNGVLKNFATFTGKQLCQSPFVSCSFIKKTLSNRALNFARFLKAPFLKNTTGWLLLFYDSCWLYSLQMYIAGNFQVVKSHWSGKNFYPNISKILQIRITFTYIYIYIYIYIYTYSFYLKKECLLVGYAKLMLYSE